MKEFYFLFNPNPDNFAIWIQDGGFTIGFLILIGLSLLLTIIYYQILGKISGKHAKTPRWFLFMVFNCLAVLIVSAAVLKSKFPANSSDFLGITQDVWFFSLLNGTLYAIVIYFILSLLLNNFSLYSKYVPFNLFKSN